MFYTQSLSLENKKTAIVVLGYKLLLGGLPDDIMIQRVIVASNLYKELCNSDNIPLFVVSGKGRRPYENETMLYTTEAEAMASIALLNGVDINHIVLENTSTSTVGNAKYTKLILQNVNISKMYISTSDFHIPRAQLSFQSIIPFETQLFFVSSHVDQDLNTTIYFEDREKRNFPPDQYNLDLVEPYPISKMVQREIYKDKCEQPKDLELDISSFNKFGSSKILSIKLEDFFKNSYIIDPDNNYTTSDIDEVNKINKQIESSIDGYQISLLYDMGLTILDGKDEFDNKLIDLIKQPNQTTFLELPQPRVYDDELRNLTMLVGWVNINEWYANRSLQDILNEITNKMFDQHSIVMNWVIIGSNVVGPNINKIIRIDLSSNNNPFLEIKFN